MERLPGFKKFWVDTYYKSSTAPGGTAGKHLVWATSPVDAMNIIAEDYQDQQVVEVTPEED